MSRSRIFFILSILCLISILSGSVIAPAKGATPAPQEPQAGSGGTGQFNPTRFEAEHPDRLIQADESLWVSAPSAERNLHQPSLLSTEGPDIFGYVWDDDVTYEWIDVSDGTDTGINCSDVLFTSDPVDIGFTFDFYEFSYTQLYISCFGFLSFQGENLDNQQSYPPSAESPNNVIAPLWTPVDTSIAYVKYKTIGTSPDQKFVIEWNTLLTDNGYSNFTFEAILHENGDIDFEYYTLQQDQGGGWSKGGGIENSLGQDGLSLPEDFYYEESNNVFHITRPPDQANVILTPDVAGRFVSASTVEDYVMTIRNYGSIGTDSYTLTTESDWSIALYEIDGTTPLANPITLEAGEEYPFVAFTTAPSEVYPSQTDVARIIATSGQEPSFSKLATITSTVPAPFAQIVDDQYEDSAMSMLTFNPEDRQTHIIPGEGIARTILELPNQNLLVTWTENIVVYDPTWHSYSVVRYVILDHDGNVVVPVTTLLDTVGLPYYPQDGYAYVAVTPDGHIGILWQRYEREIYPDERTNIYFTILEADGEGFVLDPINLTNQMVMCTIWEDPGCTQYEAPHLEATQDGRFFLAWRESSYSEDGSVLNYQYSVYDSVGTVVQPISDLTSIPDSSYYLSDLTTTVLTGSRIFLAWDWEHYFMVGEDWQYEYSLTYTVMNSDGSVFELERSLDNEWISEADAVQLTDGTIMIAHGYPDVLTYRFNGTTFDLLGPAETIWTIDGSSHALYPSIIPGPFSSAVITWQYADFEEDLWHLYYALVSSHGSLLTPAISFKNFTDSLSGMDNVIASEDGQSITTCAYEYTPFFRSDALTEAKAGLTYTYAIVADDGDLPLDTLVITAENKPVWLAFTDNGDGTATLSGVPPVTGTFAIELKVTDGSLNEKLQQFELVVTEPLKLFLPFISR